MPNLIPCTESRYFYRYEGPSHQPDDKEKLGEFFLFFPHVAFGKKIIFHSPQQIQFKVAHLALRILAGIAAIIFFEFSLVGRLILHYSKSHKLAYDQLMEASKKVDIRQEKEASQMQPVVPIEKKENPPQVKSLEAPKVIAKLEQGGDLLHELSKIKLKRVGPQLKQNPPPLQPKVFGRGGLKSVTKKEIQDFRLKLELPKLKKTNLISFPEKKEKEAQLKIQTPEPITKPMEKILVEDKFQIELQQAVVKRGQEVVIEKEAPKKVEESKEISSKPKKVKKFHVHLEPKVEKIEPRIVRTLSPAIPENLLQALIKRREAMEEEEDEEYYSDEA